MGKRGPKPKSYEIKQQKGDTHLAKSIKPDFPDRKMPRRPIWLKGQALAFWNEYAPRLHKKGLLCNDYRHSFAVLVCKSYADYIEADRQLSKVINKKGDIGLLITTKNGYPMENPLISLRKKAWEQFCKGCALFGLTPSDIGGVRAVDKPIQDKEASKFFE